MTSFLCQPCIFNNLLGGSLFACVFNELTGASFAINISFDFPFISNDLMLAISLFSFFACRVIVQPKRGGGGTGVGVAWLSVDFILVLAYTNWLVMSRWQSAIRGLRAMEKNKISKVEMARRMKTSRAALDRLLDPGNASVTLQTLSRAAHAVGRDLRIELV